MAPRSLPRFGLPWAPDMAKVRWRGTASSIVLSWVLISVFVFAFGAIIVANIYARPEEKISGVAWLAPLAVLVLGLVISALSARVAVEVDDNEMRVRFGFGWPTRHIPWASVEKVEWVEVRPWQWGGWGYKVSLLKRSSAIVLRAGEGLKVTLANGRILVVTVDGAKHGLEAMRSILADPRHA